MSSAEYVALCDEPPAPATPTAAIPGSPEKVRELIRRARAGRGLWHPADTTEDSARGLKVTMGSNGAGPLVLACIQQQGRTPMPVRTDHYRRLERNLVEVHNRHGLELLWKPAEDGGPGFLEVQVPNAPLLCTVRHARSDTARRIEHRLRQHDALFLSSVEREPAVLLSWAAFAALCQVACGQRGELPPPHCRRGRSTRKRRRETVAG